MIKKDNLITYNFRQNTTETSGVNFSETTSNGKIDIDNVNADNTEDYNMQISFSYNEYVELKSDIREIKTNINWIKWLVPIFVSIGIFVCGFITNSIKDSNAAQYQMFEKNVNQKLDSIQEINSMQIQRDIAIEIKNQKSSK